jgi:antitoxin component of RelBE/YafQ-DinJ toxin-antitoxin module
MRRTDRKRDNTLMIMVDDEEKAFIRQRAKEMGMTMSGYVRFILLLGMKQIGEANDGK